MAASVAAVADAMAIVFISDVSRRVAVVVVVVVGGVAVSSSRSEVCLGGVVAVVFVAAYLCGPACVTEAVAGLDPSVPVHALSAHVRGVLELRLLFGPLSEQLEESVDISAELAEVVAVEGLPCEEEGCGFCERGPP